METIFHYFTNLSPEQIDGWRTVLIHLALMFACVLPQWRLTRKNKSAKDVSVIPLIITLGLDVNMYLRAANTGDLFIAACNVIGFLLIAAMVLCMLYYRYIYPRRASVA